LIGGDHPTVPTQSLSGGVETGPEAPAGHEEELPVRLGRYRGYADSALQFLMQHQDYKTTQRYINMARQLNPALQNLYVPDLSKSESAY
jgi:hypothetical protein